MWVSSVYLKKMQQGRYKIESICKWKRDNSLSKPIRNVNYLKNCILKILTDQIRKNKYQIKLIK